MERLPPWNVGPSMLPRAVLVLVLTLTATMASAQTRGGATISGTVTNRDTGIPIADAHVFVSGTTAGTTTNANGEFLLRAVPLGASRLVVSRVGYTRAAHDVMVRRPIRFLLDFVLGPAITPLEEIVVSATRDQEWDQHVDRFKKQFLGNTPLAGTTSLINPEVLSFEMDDNRLRATSEAPLEIENRALGYRILYFLRLFESRGNETLQEGEALFTEMEASGPREQEAWAAARLKAYRGSSRHFLRRLFASRTREDGFYIYSAEEPRPPAQREAFNQASPFRRPQFALDPRDMTEDGPGARERFMTFGDFLEIVYTQEPESAAYRAWQGLGSPARDDYQRSWIKLSSDSVLVDLDGSVLDPYGVTYYGYMAFERIADLVPKEYLPPVN